MRVSVIGPACTSRSKTSGTRGLEADDPERRAVELDHLLVGVMRRVIGGDDVDAAVGDALEHRVAIGRLAQRRVHLEVGVVADRVRRATRRSARSGAARPRRSRGRRASLPARTARSDCRALMCAMWTCAAGQLRERDVALDHDRLGRAGNAAQPERAATIALVRDAVALERRILAVIDDRHAEHRRVLERAPHQQRRRHRPAVVGERDAAGGLLLAELGELLALRADRDGADRIDPREAGLGRLLQDELA